MNCATEMLKAVLESPDSALSKNAIDRCVCTKNKFAPHIPFYGACTRVLLWWGFLSVRDPFRTSATAAYTLIC